MPREPLVKIIIAGGIKSLFALEILPILANAATANAIISFLVRSALLDHFWMRGCFRVIQGLLIQFHAQSDVRECVTLLLRRLFVLVSLAHCRAKYKAKTVALCEALVSLGRVNISWLQQALGTISSTIGFRREQVPPYFVKLFRISPSTVDEAVLRELDLFSAAHVPLKAFPFDLKKVTQLMAIPLDLPGPFKLKSARQPMRVRSTRSELKMEIEPLVKKKKKKTKIATENRMSSLREVSVTPRLSQSRSAHLPRRPAFLGA
jgi:hypothetical protein